MQLQGKALAAATALLALTATGAVAQSGDVRTSFSYQGPMAGFNFRF